MKNLSENLPYRFTSPPSISTISSNNFSAGDYITISGNRFGQSGKVLFNDLEPLEYQNWSDSEIVCLIPIGIQSGSLSVIANNGTSNSIEYNVISSSGKPELIQHIPDISITAFEENLIADLNYFFWDPNGGSLITQL